MISLDTSLRGSQIRLRESMIKFTGSPSNELEICATNARALPFKLNRQLIKIFEDLGIEDRVFEDLQERAVEKLHASATSAISAVDFLSQQLSESASGLPSLLKALKDINIDVTEDNFLRDILGAFLQLQIRDIKYKSRIFVPQARTLYGICDETGFLEGARSSSLSLTRMAKIFVYHLKWRSRGLLPFTLVMFNWLSQ